MKRKFIWDMVAIVAGSLAMLGTIYIVKEWRKEQAAINKTVDERLRKLENK